MIQGLSQHTTYDPGNGRMSPSFPANSSSATLPMVDAYWSYACEWCALSLSGVFKGALFSLPLLFFTPTSFPSSFGLKFRDLSF
jgi:hypothetical protein